MDNFFDWFSTHPVYRQKPWLIIGKGPSYSKLKDYTTEQFFKVSLNHVVREQKVEIAHIIDSDVVLDCAQQVYENAGTLVMPWIPHIKNDAGSITLEEIVSTDATLSKMKEEGRIVYYNLASGKTVKGNSPVIPTNFFSSEAVVNLLFKAGVSKIRTIGIDGGNSYSSTFKDLADKTLLNNGHQSFDIQFKSIAKKIMKENLDYAPLDIPSPVKIYVGSMEEQMLAVRVLEYSIKKNASLPVELKPLFQSGISIPMPKDAGNKPRTPFSFQRFLIPQLNGFKGKAIYVDSDMQVFIDIKDLWARDMNGAQIFSAYETSGASRRPQYSVMLMDCEKLPWKIGDIVNKLDSGELNYEKLMYEMKVAEKIEPVIEHEWNSLELFEEGKTKLLHYTDMNRQPWLYIINPLTKVWVTELQQAVKDKFISWEELRDHIVKGNVRPSLWYQVKRKKFEPSQIKSVAKFVDRFFVPPHARRPSTSRLKLALNTAVAKLITAVV